MGRELRRKQAKKEGKSLKKENGLDYNNQIKVYIKIIVVLVVIVGLIYIISGLFVTKELKWFGMNDTSVKNDTVDSILAVSTFSQVEEEYYVYFYDFDNVDNNYNNIVSSKLEDKKVYYVDTSSAMNSNYVSTEEGNRNAHNIDELKVLAPTVIKINGDDIVEYYEGEEINNIN